MYLFNFSGKRLVLAYFLAVFLSLLIVLVKILWAPEITEHSPYLLLFTPIVVSSWIGGFGPGFVATIICTILSNYLFLPVSETDIGQFLTLRGSLFFLEGLLISLISESRKRYEADRNKLFLLEKNAYEKAQASKLRSDFLSDASKILSSSIEYKETLESVVKLIVPKIADWCIVDVVIEGKFQRLAVFHKNPELKSFADELKKLAPDANAPGGAGKVLKTGKSIYFFQVTPAIAKKTARNNLEVLNILNHLGIKSYIAVPLISSRGIVLGTISMVLSDVKRRFNLDDVKLAKDLGVRAGLAVDNSLLYKHAQEEIYKRKKFEEELKKSRDELDVILQNAADGIIVQDDSGRLTYANETAARLVGFKNAEELISTPPNEFIAKYLIIDEKGQKVSPSKLPGRKAFRGEKNPEGVFLFRNLATGEDRWAFVKARPVYDKKGNVQFAINIFSDVTARKLLEMQRDTFVSMVGHELKTPVTGIKAYNQLAIRKLKSQDSVLADYLNNIDNQVDNLNRIISDLMEVAKYRTGKMDFIDVSFSVDPLIKQCVEDLQHSTSRHKLIIQSKAQVKLLADKNRIYQVIANLLSNAIKYSPESEKVLINAKKDGKNLIVSVQDFGIGIPKESQKKVFNSFSRLVNAKSRGIPGTGLGLYISYEIIKHYKGKIWLESEEGKGSIFYFSIPILNS